MIYGNPQTKEKESGLKLEVVPLPKLQPHVENTLSWRTLILSEGLPSTRYTWRRNTHARISLQVSISDSLADPWWPAYDEQYEPRGLHDRQIKGEYRFMYRP